MIHYYDAVLDQWLAFATEAERDAYVAANNVVESVQDDVVTVQITGRTQSRITITIG